MKKMLCHGSSSIIKKSVFGFGKPYNDYGLGFHCASFVSLARVIGCGIEDILDYV